MKNINSAGIAWILPWFWLESDWIMTGFLLDFDRILPELCLDCVWILLGSCLDFAWIMPRFCILNVPGLCLDLVLIFIAFCRDFGWNLNLFWLDIDFYWHTIVVFLFTFLQSKVFCWKKKRFVCTHCSQLSEFVWPRNISISGKSPKIPARPSVGWPFSESLQVGWQDGHNKFHFHLLDQGPPSSAEFQKWQTLISLLIFSNSCLRPPSPLKVDDKKDALFFSNKLQYLLGYWRYFENSWTGSSILLFILTFINGSFSKIQ